MPAGLSANANEGDNSNNYGRAIALTLTSTLIFGVQDAIVKGLVQTYSPFQISMMRYWALALFSLFLVSRQAPIRQAFKSRAMGWQIARGVLLMADVWLFASALQTVPLAELSAMLLFYPMLVTLIAIPLLGEKVGIFRVGAVIVGFIGALVILRPGGLPFTPGLVFGPMAALAYASYIVCTRKVAQVDSTATNMVYVGVIGLVMSTVVGMFFWKPVATSDLLPIAAVMITMVLAHGIMMSGLRYAPASVLQPFNYMGLPWAITLSFLVFGHLIDFVSLLGAMLIVGAGLVIWARERKKKIKPAGSVSNRF